MFIAKLRDENELSGNMVTGDSGDELGDGSVKADESAVEIVVVGEESVDSDACVDVELRCLCLSTHSAPSSSRGSSFAISFGVSTNLLFSCTASRRHPYKKEGIWLLYACVPAAKGIVGKLVWFGLDLSSGSIRCLPLHSFGDCGIFRESECSLAAALFATALYGLLRE